MVSLRLRVISPWAYLNWLVFPLLFAAVGLFVIGPAHAGPRAAYAVLGGGLIGYWSVSYLDGGNGIQDERWNGTLEQVFAVPTPLWVILLGKICGSLLFGLLAFLPTVALSYFGFHALLPHLDPWPFAISLGVLSFTFFSIALTLTPLFALWRWAFTMLNGFELGVYILCGFMFPVAQLAGWAQGFAAVLAPGWAVRAVYASTQTGGPHDFGLWWLLAAGIAVGYLCAGVWMYRMVDVKARVSGDLALA